MTDRLVDVLPNSNALSPAALSQIEATVCAAIMADLKAEMFAAGQSVTVQQMLLPPIEKQFRQAVHARLFASVPLLVDTEGHA